MLYAASIKLHYVRSVLIGAMPPCGLTKRTKSKRGNLYIIDKRHTHVG